METPTTRYRRKREDNLASGSGSGSGNTPRTGSQEEDRVVWVHDQRLKRAVLQASDLVELAPPTPTQKPRSICSSRIANSNVATTTTTASSNTSRPRKRPCRQSRSVPIALSSVGKDEESNTNETFKVGSRTGPSSAPSVLGSEVKLELLLQRFELLSAPTSTSKQKQQGNSHMTPAGKMRGVGMGVDRQGSPVTRSSTTLARNENSRPTTRNSRNQDESENTEADMDMKVDSNKKTALSTPQTLRSRNQTLPAAPSPLSNRTNTPRLPTRTNLNTNPATRKPHAKAFKTPFLINHNLDTTRRQSPRRTIPQSPLRAPTPLHSGTNPNTRAGTTMRHNANVDIGEDEPEGNDSFDSFDGMFQEGGPEIEELFRRVDGS